MPATPRTTELLDRPLSEIIQLIPGYDPVATAGDCTFDERAAMDPIEFFAECLTFIEGDKAGQPFLLEPWQQAIVANLFGWKRPDGSRRYNEAFIYVPRKNGKSPFAAGILNYVHFCDGEAGAQCYCAAADAYQAAIVYRHARGMVEREPELSNRSKIYRTSKTVISRDDESFYRVLSADADTKHGLNTHFAAIDELHAQPNSELIDVLDTSTGTRTQPLILYITTADYMRPSVCNEKYEYYCKIRDGVFEDSSMLPAIWELTEDDDWTDPECWQKANPNLGVSVKLDYLAKQVERARRIPRYENTIKRLHFNIRTGQENRWLQIEHWDACDELIDTTALAGCICYGGLDLSSTRDLTAFVLCFPVEEFIEETGDLLTRFHFLPTFWIPDERAEERERADGIPYTQWQREGLINVTPGNSVDYRWIRSTINELGQTYAIQEIAYDPYNATMLATQLVEEDGFELVQFRQGAISYNEPCKRFETLILEHNIVHGGNPVLRWMAENVAVVEDANQNIRPVKPDSKVAHRIDGIPASVMALARAMFTDGASHAYEDGLLVI